MCHNEPSTPFVVLNNFLTCFDKVPPLDLTLIAASFPVVLGDFGCDVTCQACRENSPRTPRAIALGSKPLLFTRIARTGLGTRLL